MEGRTTAQMHHMDDCRMFGGNDTHEMELQPPWAPAAWGSFAVSGHLHTQRCHDQVMNKGVSEQESMAAVALNDVAVWPHLPSPSGTFHSSCRANFGVELAWNAPAR